MTVYKFRALLLVMTGLWMSVIAIDLLSSAGAWADFDPQDYSREALYVGYSLSLVHLVLFVLVVIGLYGLWRWGRLLAVFSTAYSILSAGFIGGSGEAGLSAVLYSATSALMIVLIAAAYWAPPIRERFERPR